MSAGGLRKYLDFDSGCAVYKCFLDCNLSGRIEAGVELTGQEFAMLVKIIARCGVQVHPEYEFNCGKALIDIPIQSFWKVFGNCLEVGGSVADQSGALAVHLKLARLEPHEGEAVPHCYRIIGRTKLEASKVDMEALFNDARHHIDISRFKQRAEVVVAATYIEAMLQTLVEGIPLETGHEIRIKRRDYMSKILCCRRHRLLEPSVCNLLDELRELRNSAAHDYEVASETNDGPFNVVSVPQAGKRFLKQLVKFVDKCEARYGEPAEDTHRFYRASEFLAGEINKVARLDSVLILGHKHPDELDRYFE